MSLIFCADIVWSQPCFIISECEVLSLCFKQARSIKQDRDDCSGLKRYVTEYPLLTHFRHTAVFVYSLLSSNA